MTNEQLYLSIGVPAVINAVLVAILMAYIKAKVDGASGKSDVKFEAINKRFDDMRDLWRAELYRVEGVLDARLKHVDERLRDIEAR